MNKKFHKIWINLLSSVAVSVSFSFFGCAPSKVYGPPEIPEENVKQMREHLDSIREILTERENSEVYGSPEIMEEYDRETNRLRQEANELEKKLEEMQK